MLDRVEALEKAVRTLQVEIKPLLPEPPPPPIPTEDPEKAKRDYDAAVAEVKNQEDRAKINIDAAKANEARAKEILDKSVAAAGPPAHPTTYPHPSDPPKRK